MTTLQELKKDLLQALADFEAEAEKIGLKPKAIPGICQCGHEIGDHIGYVCVGTQGPRKEPCECPRFRMIEPPEVNPFTTAEHYQRDRKGTWTGGLKWTFLCI